MRKNDGYTRAATDLIQQTRQIVEDINEQLALLNSGARLPAPRSQAQAEREARINMLGRRAALLEIMEAMEVLIDKEGKPE